MDLSEREDEIHRQIELFKSLLTEVNRAEARVEELEIRQQQEQWNRKVEELSRKPLLFRVSNSEPYSEATLSKERESALLDSMVDSIIRFNKWSGNVDYR